MQERGSIEGEVAGRKRERVKCNVKFDLRDEVAVMARKSHPPLMRPIASNIDQEKRADRQMNTPETSPCTLLFARPAPSHMQPSAPRHTALGHPHQARTHPIPAKHSKLRSIIQQTLTNTTPHNRRASKQLTPTKRLILHLLHLRYSSFRRSTRALRRRLIRANAQQWLSSPDCINACSHHSGAGIACPDGSDSMR